VTQFVSLEAIREAAGRLRGIARLTPLLEACELAACGPAGSSRLLLKCENLQASGAFKIRGAYNMLAQFSDEQRRAGVITYSSGNHGLAMSLAAKWLAAPAVIVMPTTAPAIKVGGAKSLGAEVLFEGTTTLHRKARAEAEAAKRGLAIVPPFDHAWVIAGQGTIGLEILDQCPEVRTVYVPVSGGGLIAGVATAVKRSKPSVRIVAVEPAGAPKVTTSLRAGKPTTLETVSGIADGLLAVRPGDLTFPHIQAFVDEVVLVDDEAIVDAMRFLFSAARLVAEPSGAATVAAARGAVVSKLVVRGLTGGAAQQGDSGPEVALVSGGNVEPDAFARHIRGAA
jgi:threonine dehydratase